MTTNTNFNLFLSYNTLWVNPVIKTFSVLIYHIRHTRPGLQTLICHHSAMDSLAGNVL